MRRSRLVLLSVAATLAFNAAPAFAARGHEFAGAFGWGVVDGKPELQRCESKELPAVPPVCQPGLAGSGSGQFDNPDGIAVNEATGDVYVVDKANNRVEFFNATGSKFEGEFDGSGEVEVGGVKIEGKAAGSGGFEEEVPTGRFDEPEGIAVDNDPSSPSFGDVYVVDSNGHKGGTFEEERMVIDKFTASGKYVGQITRNPNGEPFAEHGFQALFGVSVDPRGEVWVEENNFGNFGAGFHAGAANYTNAVVNAWIAFRSTEKELRVPAPGFAVDATDNLYVHTTFDHGMRDRLTKFDVNGEPLSREVDEEAPAGVAVESASGDVYVSHASNVDRLDTSNVSLEHPGGVSLEALKAPGTPGASFSGVAVDSATLMVYVADVANGRVDVFAPEAPGPPTVQSGSGSVSDVTATSATFAAEVNPRSEVNEPATFYTFRYGLCVSAAACPSSPYPDSIPSPEGVLAPNYEPDVIAAHVQGLVAGTVYHVRVFAHNSLPDPEHPKVVEGEELIFTTQGAGPFALPDGREWELVSPPDKHGAILLPIQGSGVIQAAANGDAVSYLANAPSESEPAGFSQTVQILSRRASSSWVSQDIATPHEATVGFSLGAGQGEYRFFSEDLSSAVVQPFGPFTEAVSPKGSERTAYLRTDFPAGDPSRPCDASCYRPLVAGCPEAGEPCPAQVQEVADVPEGTKFGEEGKCQERCFPYFLGATPDAGHIILTAQAPLLEGAPEWGLYEWAAGRLTLVSVLPNEQPAQSGTTPGLGFYSELPLVRIARHAISADGGRVVFSESRGSQHLYLRDTASGHEQTLQLDTPEAACVAEGKCKGTVRPVFQTANADDSRIFFTDSQPLTQGSGISDLYECAVEETEEGQLACNLSDLTPPGAGEEGAGVLGLMAGASEDASAIYFTANGKLTTEASARGEQSVTGNCRGNADAGAPAESDAAPERCNLYVRTGGQTRLVAVLSGADFPDWSLRGGAGLRGLTDRVSPDGRYLAFSSRRSLSGYDNRDAQSGKPDQEVFLYDSAANSGQGALSCASCDPSGGRPRGVQYSQIDTDEAGLAGGSAVWPATTWIAANVPGWTAVSAGEGFALHQSRYLSDSGRLFFNAADALVSQDTNRTEDVYEYEPPGVGDCTTAKGMFAPGSGGCVNLITSGTAKQESVFLDASESGDDVFFLTGQRLLPKQDVDNSFDLYDAHACSADSPCLPAPPEPLPACEGDACQSPVTPPEDPTPASLTFQGPGNPIAPAAAIVKPKPTPAQVKAANLKKALKACHAKKNKKKRTNCERAARKKYSVHASKKANRGR